MSYFSQIFGHHPHFLAHNSINPWNFLSDNSNRIIFGLSSSVPVNTSEKVTFGSYPRVGAGCQEKKPSDERAGIFSLTLRFLGRREPCS